jgi:sugar phosphate isomerase/epimerase
MEQVAAVCRNIGIKAVYQVHHGMLVASATAAYHITRDLPDDAVGVMLDPGNQAFEGFEEWCRSVPLLGSRLCAIGVKDVAVTRDPSERESSSKGWKRDWAPIDEGITDWHSLFRALHRIDFDGTLVWMPFIEPEDHAANARIIKREVAYLRGILAGIPAC